MATYDRNKFRFDSPHPRLSVPAPGLAASAAPAAPARDDFAPGQPLARYWNTLREPAGREISLDDRPGWLRLHAQPRTLETNERQALLARRLEARDFQATTCMDFAPTNDWQFAGLICYYSHTSYFWLRVTRHTQDGKVVELIRRHGERSTVEGRISADNWQICHLRVQAFNDRYQFMASADAVHWIEVGQGQDGTILSDEGASEFGPAFTGTFIGMAAVDIACEGACADFDWFEVIWSSTSDA